MFRTNVLALMLAFSSSCLGQEKMKVDIDGAATKTAPKTNSGRVLSSDNSRRNLIWRVDLIPSATANAGSTTLEIRIANVSALPRMLPVSQDGLKLVAECPDHTVLQGEVFLGSKADATYFSKVGLLYGCPAFPDTIVQLKPGEWISYVTRVPTDRLPNEIRAQTRFSRTRYQQGANGQTAEDLEYDTSEFSPWVAVPGATSKGAAGPP